MKISIFILILCVFFSSCSKEDTVTPISTSNVNSTVSSGSWKVTYYWDTDHDETTNYSGYSFTFGGNNTLVATKTSSTITGTWATGTDDSKVKLILNFSGLANFVEISDDWQVIERTDIKIKLQDVSGGGSGTDYLTFEKD